MKQLLVDENLPPGLCRALAMYGIEATHVSGIGLVGARDTTIGQQALLMEAAIATKDADFVDLATIRDEGQVVLFKAGNMRIGEVLRFAERHFALIREFPESADQVMVLRA